ncbi:MULTISPECIES: sigma-54 dependent transcriptional regulator [Marinobacter]|uniref:sigma-54 dependent transcriptional regulator n=1 Tax=Marinobacter TaxID=2742 RepID=UPI0013A6E804|nr:MULTISPECIES: sigma-54 dependent transcriptional regulator [Marinobacter]
MTVERELIWLSPGGRLPTTFTELARHWIIHPVDLGQPPRRRPSALPRVRVGVIDLGDVGDPSALDLEDWIETLSPAHWISLLPSPPDQNSLLSDIVAGYCTDYHTRPYDLRRLDVTLGHLWGMARLMALRQHSRVRGNFEEQALDGESPAIVETRALLRRIAQTTEPVLILGESGTGRNTAAHFIHDHSDARQGPFVLVNCAALPPTLTQSELFGHEKGAFTHALSARAGRIEQADGGTLVLSDIDELQLEQQSTLLRFLQESVVERLGSHNPRRVRVRVIATTTHPLEQRVREEQFRADIFYRLGNLQVQLPPLRDRLEDLPFLCNTILRHAHRLSPHKTRRLCEDAMACLLTHNWPGNLRELHNRLQRAVLLSESDTITPEDLGLCSRDNPEQPRTQLSLERFRARAEREAITYCLNIANHNVSAAARLLRISRLSLYRLMAKHGTAHESSSTRREPVHRKGGHP